MDVFMKDERHVYLWKRYKVDGREKLHLGKYDADTGKWIKWESQKNNAATMQADSYARNGIFAPDSTNHT